MLDQATVDQVKEAFTLHDPLSNLKSYYQFYDSMLDLLGLPCDQDIPQDGRIIRAVNLIKGKEEIGYDIIGDILRATHISQSRLSHLFKEQAGMPLNSYLAMIKLEKKGLSTPAGWKQHYRRSVNGRVQQRFPFCRDQQEHDRTFRRQHEPQRHLYHCVIPWPEDFVMARKEGAPTCGLPLLQAHPADWGANL